MLSSIEPDRLVAVVGGNATVLGRWMGLRLGTWLTRALWLSPKFRAQVPGMPRGFQVRHEPVVGPILEGKVASWPARLQAWGHGLASGATEAPGYAYYTRFFKGK